MRAMELILIIVAKLNCCWMGRRRGRLWIWPDLWIMREMFGSISSGSSDEGAGDERIGVKAVGSWARYPTRVNGSVLGLAVRVLVLEFSKSQHSWVPVRCLQSRARGT